MKKVVVIVAVVLAIVVLSPFVTGRMTESALQDAIKLQENPWVAIEIADYDRGWFSSEATVRYRFSDSYQQMLNTALGEAANTAGDGAEVAFDGALLTPLTIDHGLVFLSNGLGFGLNRMSGNLDVSQFDVLSDFQTLAGVDSLMTFSSTTGLTGASSFDIASPQIAIDEDGTQFSFQGFSADGTAQLTTGQVDMEGTMPGLSIVSTGGDEPMNLTIGETRMTADVQQHSTYVTVGDVSFVMSEIAVEGDDAKIVFTDLAVEQSTTLSEAGLLDIDVVYKLAGLTGPDVSVDDMLVNLEMDNIRPEALEAYMDYNQKMTDQIMQAAANPDEASVDSEAVMAEMASMVHQVLQGSPELRITPMSAVIDGEQVAANMDLRFDASVLPALDQFNFMDLAMWKQMLSLDADVALPVAMAEQMMRSSARSQMQAAVAQSGQEMTEEQIDQMVDAQLPMMLGMLEQQGMMIKSESGYASTAKFADGQLTVNGNLIPLPF
ncbi:MAG: YdgA family protein [Pseudomonadaceae bacterium]|nr:YdgA family protein [Pseudomonadaceae bacterium]